MQKGKSNIYFRKVFFYKIDKTRYFFLINSPIDLHLNMVPLSFKITEFYCEKNVEMVFSLNDNITYIVGKEYTLIENTFEIAALRKLLKDKNVTCHEYCAGYGQIVSDPFINEKPLDLLKKAYFDFKVDEKAPNIDPVNEKGFGTFQVFGYSQKI